MTRRDHTGPMRCEGWGSKGTSGQDTGLQRQCQSTHSLSQDSAGQGWHRDGWRCRARDGEQRGQSWRTRDSMYGTPTLRYQAEAKWGGQAGEEAPPNPGTSPGSYQMPEWLHLQPAGSSASELACWAALSPSSPQVSGLPSSSTWASSSDSAPSPLVSSSG